MFRTDDAGQFNTFYPLIVKANQAGVLETILEQADKILKGHYQVSIADSGLGSITEADIANAQGMNAHIIGFDVTCTPGIERQLADSGIVVRLHKLIYKFQEDL